MGPRADLVKKVGPRADVNMNCTLYLQEPVAFGWGLILLFLAVLFLVVCFNWVCFSCFRKTYCNIVFQIS